MSEATARAEHAARLLGDPLLKESLDLIEKDVISQWEACPVRDVEGREMLWKFYMTARKFRGILHGAIENGKIAAMREQQSLKEKALNIIRR